MKNIIVTMCFILLSAIGFSQDNITKELGTFNEVKAYDGISVKLIKSDANKAVIKGKNKKDVEIVNKDGKLKIRMTVSEAFDGYNTFVELYHKENIYIIDANEQAFIENSEPYKQTEIELKAQEGGEISVYLDVERLEVKAVTGGKIETFGKANLQEISINTGGEYMGQKLETRQAYVEVNAGGNAEINASEYAEAEVRAGGSIDVYGKPKVLDKKTFLGGKIKEY